MKLPRRHVVGSMLRTKSLLEMLPKYRQGLVEAAAFKRVEDSAVDQAIRIQEAAGIDVITDGEQRRIAFGDVLAQSVKGIDRAAIASGTGTATGFWKGSEDLQKLPVNHPTGGTIVGKLVRNNSRVAEEFVYARSRAARPIKVTLPSPTLFAASWSADRSKNAYGNIDEAMSAIVEILNEEIHALAELGCEHVQIDAPELTFAIDPNSRMLGGQSRETFCQTVVDRLNQVAVEPRMTYSVHFCRGNARGLWHSAGGYEAVSKLVFPQLGRFKYILLEYDSDRAGGFAPLKDLPSDCCAVLGLVTTKSGELESQKSLVARVNEASKHLSLEQLAVSPQCGFAADFGGNPITLEQQAAKLRLVSDVATQIWR